MFKPDKLGNTFFFVDMNYSNYNIDLAYWEIARVFKTAKMPVGLHVEYDGGLGQLGGFGVMQAYQITGSFLAGVDYSYNTEDFSKGFSVKALYKYIHEKHDLSFQLTAVWYMHFFNKKLSFTGFADFWREDWDFDFDGKTDTKFIFLTEPQIWYNLNELVQFKRTFFIWRRSRNQFKFCRNERFSRHANRCS